MIKLYNGDSLEILKAVPDKSVNLVVTDPPYNISKAEWDKIPNYVEWCGRWLKECERVLKDNGTLYFFHNDMTQIAQLMEHIRQNTNFRYNSFIIWDKGDFRALSWKNPSKKNTLRCWFNTCEYVLCYVKGDCLHTEWDRTGWEKVKLDVNNFVSLRKYAYDVLCYIGGGGSVHLSNMSKEFSDTGEPNTFSIADLESVPGNAKRKVMQTIGGKVDHFTRYGSTQWDLCTPETYQELIDKFNIDKMIGFREYEDLRREYEDLRREYEDLRREYEDLRFTHNLDKNHNNLWTSNEKNNGALHPTKKPVDILERIIKTSSNEGDVVLDCFMGSGSTGVACVNTGRSFIGIELDDNYYSIAEERVNNAIKEL